MHGCEGGWGAAPPGGGPAFPGGAEPFLPGLYIDGPAPGLGPAPPRARRYTAEKRRAKYAKEKGHRSDVKEAVTALAEKLEHERDVLARLSSTLEKMHEDSPSASSRNLALPVTPPGGSLIRMEVPGLGFHAASVPLPPLALGEGRLRRPSDLFGLPAYGAVPQEEPSFDGVQRLLFSSLPVRPSGGGMGYCSTRSPRGGYCGTPF